ncbi:calcium-transporting atpase 3 [Phaffia rhodozyma]|uniref:Calcium-transporting atpase 3 n=1 Tax=Phaffia rhodozyma TaxID=264483 RepID=A0A0F7SG58_PHARH|nr:calcium-transporting atpase 3 [Phaffia rhodozyma]
MAKSTQFVAPAPPLPGPAHITLAEDLIHALESNIQSGLHESKVKELQAVYGPNQIKPPKPPSATKLLLRQVANAMTIVLLMSMAVSFGTQDWIEAGVIAALVILNVSVGFSQEWKAEKTVAALSSVGSPVAEVIRNKNGRDGIASIIQVEEVVPGDIILLKNGDVVPADARVLPEYVSSLETDEALLTGESLPVGKKADILDVPDCPVGDRKNMVFSGSTVTKGRARCLVTGTGMNTELGKIAEAMERKETIKDKGWRAKWYKFKVIMGTAGTSKLQIKLNKLAYILLGWALLLAFIVVASTGFSDIPFSIATYAVATAVSILPASLIAVVSLTLSNAAQELSKRNALVRRMDAIESLSTVTDICSDKTGTITVGKMVVKKAWIPAESSFQADKSSSLIDTTRGQAYTAESGSDPFYPRGLVRALPRIPSRKNTQSSSDTQLQLSNDDDDDDEMDSEDIVRISEIEENFKNLVLCASLCNMAVIHKGDEGKWQASGDATEIALQVFAHKLGMGKPHMTHKRHDKSHHHDELMLNTLDSRTDETLKNHPTQVPGNYSMVIEHPFDSTVKRMSTAWKFEALNAEESTQDMFIFMKGAVERVLDRCAFIGLSPENQVKLTDENRQQIIHRMDKLAAEGLRVLALSGKLVPIAREAEIKAMPRDELETGVCFLGLAGIYDPPRPQSKGAVLDAIKAGITPRMLTGDHPATATAISKAVGILNETSPQNCVMTGQQFDALTEDQIDALPELPLVVARCAPDTKVRMVEAIHRRSKFGMQCTTIMTGDGVNDCPALKRADVGFAMGEAGSDVAKGAAEVVLADDNFATIIRAIRKGRGVLTNLSKFLLFLLSGNIAEVLVLLVGLAFKDPTGNSVYPLSPVAALFINTICAGPPALALGLEPTAKDAMLRNPGDFRTIFTTFWWLDLFFYGFLIGGLTIVNFVIVVWGTVLNGGKGQIGLECNDGHYNASQCQNIFHGRSAAFSTLMLLAMVHSLECKSLEKSIFQMKLTDNKILLWSVGICSLVVFPIVYIPVINDYVFQIVGMGWEWGIVFGALVVYLLATEMWKLSRRMMYPLPVAELEKDGLPRFDTIADEKR